MAQLAKVVSVTGNAFVVAADGSRRPVKVGDIIQKDETVITAAGAHVELMMNDGQMMAVAPEHSVRVDETMVHSEATPSAQDAAVQTATVDQVIQALDRGGDLTDQLEATAAGGGAGGGGGDTTFVRLLRITEGVEPLAYDYSLGAPAPINEVLLSATAAATPEPVTLAQTLKAEEESVPGKGGNNEDDGLNYTTSGSVWTGGATGNISTINVAGFAPVSVATGGSSTIYFDANGNPIAAGDTETPAAAKLTVNSSGTFTFEVLGAMHHDAIQGENDLSLPQVQLIGTASDGAATTLNLSLVVQDDIPLIKAGAAGSDTVNVNEDDLLAGRNGIASESQGNDDGLSREPLVVNGDIKDNVDWGADGFGKVTGVSWTGGSATIADGATSTTVYIKADGTVGTSSDYAVSVQVNSNGTYTVTLSDNMLVSGVGENVVALLTNGFTIAAQDADGDAVAGGINVNVNVTDDIPVFNSVMDAVLSSATQVAFNGQYSANFGADGVDYLSAFLQTGGSYAGASVNFVQSASGVAGVTKVDVVDAASKVLFTFYIDADTSTVASGGDGSTTLNAFSNLTDPTHSEFFTLTVNADGTYTFDMISNSVITHTTVTGTSFTAEGPSGSKSVPDGSLTVYGGDQDPAVENVNTSSLGIGLGQPTISEGEWLKLDFTKLQLEVGFDLVQWGGSGKADLRITIDGVQFDFDASAAGANDLIIDKGSVSHVNVVVDAAKAGTFTNTGGVLTLYVATQFDLVQIDNVTTALGGAKFGINNISYDTQIIVEDMTLNFQLSTTDGDGDTSTLADSLTIAMVAPNEPVSYASDANVDQAPGVVLVGNGENDTLTGGSGNDILIGDGGNDHLDGGAGVDTASYAEATSGVQVNLALGTSVGGAGADTLVNIENIVGSSHDDALTGNTLANVLDGGAGNDALAGGDGNDTLIGGAGNDVLTGGLGADVFQWHLGDQGTTATPARDVTDFNVGQNDALDLKDLLTGEHNGTGVNTNNLGDYLHFGTDSVTGKLTLEVDHNGTSDGATFHADQTIVLSNYADQSALASALGLNSAASAADILNKMVQNGQLKTDI